MSSRGAQLIGIALLPEVTGSVSDPMSGFFLVRRSVLEGVPMSPRGFKILLEVLGRTRPAGSRKSATFFAAVKMEPARQL